MIYLLIVAATLGYVYWRLHVTNMYVPPNVEKAVTAREALHVALDNDLPLQVVHYIQPREGKPL